MDELLLHSSHCDHCISSSCSFTLCPLSECIRCYAPLHECKREDHREICPLEKIPCVNASFGCPLSLRRDFISRHLPNCSASIVVCPHERSRAAIDKPSKKELKAIGKGRKEREYECPSSSANLPIDEALALFDQSQIIDAYTYSRRDRTRRRDRINIHEPLLPLRPIVDGGILHGLIESEPLLEQDDDIDSSADEKKIEDAKMAKKRAIFSNCYMCQVDPATQHFHTLGRADARWDSLLLRRPPRSHYERAAFYRERRMMVALHVEKIPETIHRSENILKICRGGTLYTRRCLAEIPRRDIEGHQNSQHVKGGDVDLESMITRCPMWESGCTFHSARLRPKEGGQMRFIQELPAFSYRPELSFTSPINPSDSCPLLDSPPLVILEVSRFLSGVALRSLASTCREIREILFSMLALDRGIVSTKWRKIDRGRWTSSFAWSFPLTETSPEFSTGPDVEMAVHIGTCRYNVPCPLPEYAAATADQKGAVPVGGVSCVPPATREEMIQEIFRRSVDY